MEKSKQLLVKTSKIIFFTFMVMFFLEIDLFSPVRTFISSYITFFQNKGTLISNICLGIFGSAILTYVSEYCEYKSIKRRIQNDILRFFRKWNKEIEPQILDYIDNIEYVGLIEEDICQYWEEVYLLYNMYLPYNRNDLFVSIIRALYEYINEFKRYADNKRSKDKILKNLEILVKLNEGKPTDSNITLIEAIEANEKAFQDLDNVYKSDEKLLDLINNKRSKLNAIIPDADMLEFIFAINGAEKLDFRHDLSTINNEIAKQRLKRIFDIKGLWGKVKYKYMSIRYKKYFID